MAKLINDMTSSMAEQRCRRFSLVEIHSATAYFSDAFVIGNGGFGKVYIGLIDNRSVTVAIKRLAPKSNQGEAEFAAEIETLTKLRHRNLVSLIGYCSDQGEMILVYDYMANGTLAAHRSSLAWKHRLHVCIGAARGLDYLHTGSSIIHRDVKSTNILLDEDFVARVSDFGLAKQMGASSAESHVSASVKGSFGYFDPSYFTTGRLTRKSDTYAFGVVLLELLSGKPAVDRSVSEDESCLTMWAREKMSKGKTEQIVASNLRGEIAEDCLKTFAELVKRCLHRDPKKRPTMTQIVVQLELALGQQKRRTWPTSSQLWPLNAFWNIVKPYGSTKEDLNLVDVGMLPIGVPAISLDQLKIITNNFSPKFLIKDAIGGKTLHHAFLRNGKAAAIERLYHWPLPNQEFIQQVSVVSGLKHENVVELLVYSVHGDMRFLAYEFSPRGSLYDILHSSSSGRDLSWAQRVKIALGAAKGLEYIHRRGHIHCNIQSSNILLFDDNVAKIAGFDLSTRRLDDDEAYYREIIPFSTFLRRFYSSPECVLNGELGDKSSDVYSFGVVILELVTCRTPWDLQWLIAWAKRKDPVVARLEGNYQYPTAAAKMAEVAASCLVCEADYRPSMSRVVQSLQSLLE